MVSEETSEEVRPGRKRRERDEQEVTISRIKRVKRSRDEDGELSPLTQPGEPSLADEYIFEPGTKPDGWRLNWLGNWEFTGMPEQ